VLEYRVASRFLVTTSVVHELVEGTGLDMGRSLALVIMLVAVLGGIDNLWVHQICLVLIIGVRWMWQGVRGVDQSRCGTDDYRLF
jgi:hypothetical protein